ncbi:MAG: shikimate dehydrogenase [Candidatus Acidiferrales bacterium]
MFDGGKICGVVAARDAKSMLKQLDRALLRTRTVELRLDWLANDAEITRFLRRLAARTPRATMIATCRRREAGGLYRGSIAKQLVLLAEALRAGCAWYDLDIETASKCPKEPVDVLLGSGKQLASAHFFHGMPKSLNRVAAKLRKSRPDAIKIASECKSLADAVKLLRVAHGKRSVTAVPMGDAVPPARILALQQGSALAYAPVENTTAPGQFSLEDMVDLYRADRLDRRTRTYGVIGNPVGHSLSPQLQNAGFQARRINAVYLPFLVRDLGDFLAAIKPLGIAGFSVTLPHKEAMLRRLDGCDPLARAIGAVNTVVVRPGGKLYGYNTDYVGILRSLEHRIQLSSSRVLVVGAGGVARAVAFALVQAEAAVCISSRRKKPAQTLAKMAGAVALPPDRIKHEFFDAIVNATPVGMYPFVTDSPLDAAELNCRLVFDTIYRPRVTKLMQLAARRGIECISGVEMFVAQGTAQWEIWTGERAPVQTMRRAVERALACEETVNAHTGDRIQQAPR